MVRYAIHLVGRLTDSGLAADHANRRAFLHLAQDEGNLRLRELRSLHGPSLSNGSITHAAKPEFSSNDRSRKSKAGQVGQEP